jgi:CubicO group peptidase (beta-lactamase class C family)
MLASFFVPKSATSIRRGCGINAGSRPAHQAGLFAFDEPVDRSTVADLDRLAIVLARQKPAWEPGTRQAYHALSLGFYEGELLRRLDRQHRSLGQFFQDEIASRLGATSISGCLRRSRTRA